MQKVTVQALRDIQLIPELKAGERRELSAAIARILYLIGAVKLVSNKARAKSKETA